MPACNEGAHCAVVAPGASFAGAYGAGAGFRTAGFMGVSLYPPGSDDKEWDNSKPTYVRTITLKDWGTNRGKPVESVQPEQIEHKPAVSGFGDRLMRIVRPVHEPFEPSDFVKKTGEFLGSIGAVHIASLEVDGTHVYVLEDENNGGFATGLQKADQYFESHRGSIGQIDLKVFGRSSFFYLEMVITYRPIHSPHEPALSVAIGARPAVLHVTENETYEQYTDRTAKLRANPAAREAFEKEVEEKGRELVSDLSYHISSTFPGARFSVIEQDESSEML